MCKNLRQLVLGAVGFAIIAQVLHTIGSFLTMNYYTDPTNFGLWSKIMMPNNGAPGTEFFVLSAVFALITGFIFAYAYSMHSKNIQKKIGSKGITFGIGLFVIVGVPYTLTNYLLLAIPTALLLEWALETLAIYVLAGIAFEKIIK